MTQHHTEYVLMEHGADTALSFHLSSRLFPPMSGGEALAKLAIEAVNEGEPDRIVDDGVSRRGPAGAIIDSWHLEVFLDSWGELGQ